MLELDRLNHPDVSNEGAEKAGSSHQSKSQVGAQVADKVKVPFVAKEQPKPNARACRGKRNLIDTPLIHYEDCDLCAALLAQSIAWDALPEQ